MLTEEEKEIIVRIEKITKLQYLEAEEEGNLCFATNNSEMRDDFKISFSLSDFRKYQRSFQGEELQLPKDDSEFWERIRRVIP